MAKRGKRKKLKVGRRPKQVERTPRGYSQLIAQAAVHYQRGQVREAEQIYLRILQQHPNDADVLTCLGWLAYSQGQYERAIQLYQQSLAYNSKANPELHNNMAIALVETGKTNEAIGHLQQAIGLRPDYAEARNNLAQLISSNLSPQQKDSITISPETKTKLQIAITHQQAGKWQDAERIYHKLLQQDPYNVNVIQELGDLYCRRSKLEGAIGYYRQALSLKPNSPELLSKIGSTLVEQNKIDEAIDHHRQALTLDPNHIYGHWGLAMALLITGDLQQGFAEHEWRWQMPLVAQHTPYHSLPYPLWDGTPLAGQTILLYEEQGLGDSIQFIRYAPLVKQQGGKVIVACSQALKRLFSTIPEIDRIIVNGDPPPEIHFRAPLMSLPYLLGTTIESIPARIPYLYPKEAESAKSTTPETSTSDKLKVGIVWASKPNHLTFSKRSCDLDSFLQLLTLPDITLYSLQKNFPQPPELQNNKNIIFLGDKLNDFADTAAIIQELDLIITVDTSVAHLAGALAKPVWTLLAFSPNWRWMLDREDSPWYPTMRLFRQSQPGDWTGVFVEVKAALASSISRAVRGPISQLSQSESVAEYPVPQSDIEGGHRPGQALARNPNHNVDERSLTNRALVAYKEGRLTAAAQLCQEIIRHFPENTEALNLMGAIAQAHSHKGIGLGQQGKRAEAIEQFQQAIALEPKQARHHIGLAIVLQEQGLIDEAITHYQQALAQQARIPLIYNNLAIAQEKQGKIDLALSNIKQAIALQPNYIEAHFNHGNILSNIGQTAEAIQAYQQAIHHKPDYPEPHITLGRLLLQQGKLKQGFAEFEWRWQIEPFAHEKAYYPVHRPQWDGTPLKGRTILLYCEQGLGGAIQFIRYVPLIQQQNGRILVECRKPLLRLFSTVPAIAQLIERGTPRPHFHLQASLMSLPHIFGTTLDTIPAQTPYLQSQPPSAALKHLLARTATQKIGIAWRTSPTSDTAKDRACTLSDFLPLLELSGIAFYILQKGQQKASIAQLGFRDKNLIDLDAELQDLADTAAAMQQLDLIITVDTAVAHLAGALGKPVWVLLPFVPDWRWMLDREDSPWYPTMRLFRQSQPGDWTGVFVEVKAALASSISRAVRGPISQLSQSKSIASSPVSRTQSEPEQTHNTKPQLQIALAHHQAGKLQDAERIYQQILQQEPHNIHILQLLGQLYYQTGQLEQAGSYYSQALTLNPNSPQLLCIYGDTMTGRGKIEEAIKQFRQALALDPKFVYGHWGLAVALLLSGDMQQGFAEYEWRWQLPELAQRPCYTLPVPLWKGTPLAGQTILLYEEQGLGDSIQFIRYIPLVKQLGGKIIVSCSQELKRLFSTIPEIDLLITDRDPLPEINLRAPLMSLPHLLETTMENIPAQVPYLYAKEEDAVKYSGSLQTSDKFKVGIVWASKLNDPTSGKRSCDLKQFLKLLLSLPGMTFYSLQKDFPPPLELQDNKNLIFLGDKLTDFADTAAIIQELDLVITIDTAAAHLAGALGKPVWTLLHFAPDWRWMRDRPDSPWYPTMRLFRQSQPRDWTGVFAEVEAALRFTLAQRYQAGPGNEGKLQDAERIYYEQLPQTADNADTIYLLGSLYQSAGKLDEAIGYFRLALALDPNSVYGHVFLGTALLLSGDLQQGLAEHNWRWRIPGFARPVYHFLPAPLWDGSPFPGQTILLYSESGLGDAIQFIRYAPLVKQLADKVIVACSPALKRLFSTIPEIDGFIEESPSLMPEVHLRARIMSLPYLLDTTTEEKIPAQVPYLYAKEENEAVKYSGSLRTSDKFKVGIVWAPKTQALDYESRSCDLSHFLQLLSLPGITLYSLQKDVPQPRELQDNASAKNIIFLGDKLNDFADTAAIIQELDIVITVDTSVAHLAGALAKPVWTLLCFNPDWRWMLDREDSPWYPTMRLFRQSQPGDWTGVFVEVKAALASFISQSESVAGSLVSTTKNHDSTTIPEAALARNPNHNVDERSLTNRALVA